MFALQNHNYPFTATHTSYHREKTGNPKLLIFIWRTLYWLYESWVGGGLMLHLASRGMTIDIKEYIIIIIIIIASYHRFPFPWYFS
jgi:hypothetical protein